MSWTIKWIFLVALVMMVVAKRSESKGYELPYNCTTRLECAEYDVIHSQSEFEIRSYKNATWVSTAPINSSFYRDAAGRGFKILYSYFQGNNDQSAKITMTAPVLTTIIPSMNGPFCNSSFVVHFYLPRKYQKNPPQSSQLQAHPTKLPKHKYVAVRRFGGFMDDTSISTQAYALKKSLKDSTRESAIIFNSKILDDHNTLTYSVAGYNSPFQNENRVNEILLWFD